MDYCLKQITKEDWPQVAKMYEQARGRQGCVWTEEYPSEALLLEDIAEGDLWGFQTTDKKWIASVAIDRDEEVAVLDCWSKQMQPSAELARLVVDIKWSRQGIAGKLVQGMMKVLAERGYQSAHYLVAQENQIALRAYKTLNFQRTGETVLHGIKYECYEKCTK